MTLEEAIEHAAEQLPDGFNIELQVEAGAAVVKLNTPDGVSFHDFGQQSLADEVVEAVTYAIKIRRNPLSAPKTLSIW